jgi:hypothetical protein
MSDLAALCETVAEGNESICALYSVSTPLCLARVDGWSLAVNLSLVTRAAVSPLQMRLDQVSAESRPGASSSRILCW